jgi:hypothetical protein
MSVQPKENIEELKNILNKFNNDLQNEKDYDSIVHMKTTWVKNRDYIYYNYNDNDIQKLYNNIEKLLDSKLAVENTYVNKK